MCRARPSRSSSPMTNPACPWRTPPISTGSKGDDDVRELGLDDLLATHLVIMEWPDRLKRELTANRLNVELVRRAAAGLRSLPGEGPGTRALSRLDAIAHFLKGTPWAESTRNFLEGDASFRRYERLSLEGRTAVLMDMPARPDGPPVRQGKSYSAIAHLAENIRAVVAVNSHLRERGLSAPEIYSADLDRGLAVIEDLDDRVYGRMLALGTDLKEEMAEAVRLLARNAVEIGRAGARHAMSFMRFLPIQGRASHRGRTPPRLAMAAPQEAHGLRGRAAKLHCRVGQRARSCDARKARMDIARLPLAQSDLVAGAPRLGACRPHRHPGLRPRPPRVRSRLHASGCAHRHSAYDR